MTNSHLRLVHSATPSKRVDKECKKQDITDAQQLSLFDDFDGIRIIFVPVSEVSHYRFIRALEEKTPYLLVDTRPYPEFLYIFASHERALAEFGRRGIEYNQVPLQCLEPGEPLWEQLDSLKSILTLHLQRNTDAPIFVLSSTNYTLDKISRWLKGYISQEVADARFEAIGE